jgi:hypothetical protein
MAPIISWPKNQPEKILKPKYGQNWPKWAQKGVINIKKLLFSVSH